MAASDVWSSPALGAASPSTEVPILRGSGGLTGRPRVRPINDDFVHPLDFDEQGEPVFAQEPAKGKSFPGSCLRVLTAPQAMCSGDCAGTTRDGHCLAEIARDNPGAEFEVDPDGYWLLKG